MHYSSEVIVIAGCEDADCAPFLTCSCRAADTMNIIIAVTRDIIIVDVRDPGDIKPSCRDISADQHADALCMELLHYRVPFLLRQSTVDRKRVDTHSPEVVRHKVGIMPRVAEDHDQSGLLML